MDFIARQDRRTQLFIRALTNGVLSERDYLLNYSIGEFYQEWSLFVEENEKKTKAIEALKLKRKN